MQRINLNQFNYKRWCGPCKSLLPKLLEKAENSKLDWSLVKCDVDKLPDLAKAFKIKGIPTVFLIHENKVKKSNFDLIK
jgi:thioredoxin 1